MHVTLRGLTIMTLLFGPALIAAVYFALQFLTPQNRSDLAVVAVMGLLMAIVIAAGIRHEEKK